MTSRLSSNFQVATDGVRRVEQMTEESLSTWDMIVLARTLGMSIEEVRQVKGAFDVLDGNENGLLEFDEFERAVMLLLKDHNTDVPTAIVRQLCRAHWQKTDKNKSGTIDFQEFLRWWAGNRFKEDLLLSSERRLLRELAQKNGVTLQVVEHIKSCFDLYDTDGSGMIDVDEFKQIIYKIMRVPQGVELPEGRTQHLWREIDCDNSGKTDFGEFLPWWLKRSSSLMPYDTFYRRIRCLETQTMDPSPYSLDGKLCGPGTPPVGEPDDDAPKEGEA
mmetsp:Transcript_49276/g.110938  ORF Transcript_49276/g.110938 Transcript_49276/m.110938 type:complete len:275 (-) Transcript_49276:9-833(-)